MLAEPFLLKVLSIVNGTPSSESAALTELQKKLKQDLQSIDAKVASQSSELAHADWLTIKRMLVYWADELLTTHIPEWQNYVLELDYFRERDRAWKFYVEADQHLPTAGAGCAELFYLAVVLGFRGDIVGAYRHELKKELPGGRSDSTEARRYWAQSLQRQIRSEQAAPPAGEPLQGDAHALAGDAVHTASLVLLIMSCLCLFIVSIWYLKNLATQNAPQTGQTTAQTTEQTKSDVNR